MFTLANLCIFIGVLMIVSRAPLIFAPEKYRALILSWVSSPSFMRLFGGFVLALGGLITWITSSESGLLAIILNGLGWVMLVFGLVFMLPFATAASDLASQVWSGFRTSTLRVLGVGAVLFGGWLALYGLSL